MRRLIWLITICIAGLGGYYLGQQPGSPRIFEWMFERAEQFEQSAGSEWMGDSVDAGRRRVASLFSSEEKSDSSVESTPPAAPVAPATKAAPVTVATEPRPCPIPRCW